MTPLSTGAEALADAGDRLVLASDLIEDNLKAGIREDIAELERLTAPSNAIVFEDAQARFEELAATAQDLSLTNAERAEALEALSPAFKAFKQATLETFAAGPATKPLLAEMLETLKKVNASDILVTTDRDILEAQAASLAEIELTTAAQPTAASSSSSFSSLASSIDTSIATLGGGIIDPSLLATLIENLNGTQQQVESTISELVDVLGADIFADVVESIGALPFADLVNSLDAAGLNFGDFVDEIGAIDLTGLNFDEIVAALGPAGAIVSELGAENFAEIVTALAPILGSTSGTTSALTDESSAMVSKLASMKDEAATQRHAEVTTAVVSLAWLNLSDEEKTDLHLNITWPGRKLKELAFYEKVASLDTETNGECHASTKEAVERLVAKWHARAGRI